MFCLFFPLFYLSPFFIICGFIRLYSLFFYSHSLYLFSVLLSHPPFPRLFTLLFSFSPFYLFVFHVLPSFPLTHYPISSIYPPFCHPFLPHFQYLPLNLDFSSYPFPSYLSLILPSLPLAPILPIPSIYFPSFLSPSP